MTEEKLFQFSTIDDIQFAKLITKCPCVCCYLLLIIIKVECNLVPLGVFLRAVMTNVSAIFTSRACRERPVNTPSSLVSEIYSLTSRIVSRIPKRRLTNYTHFVGGCSPLARSRDVSSIARRLIRSLDSLQSARSSSESDSCLPDAARKTYTRESSSRLSLNAIYISVKLSRRSVPRVRTYTRALLRHEYEPHSRFPYTFPCVVVRYVTYMTYASTRVNRKK